jgi:hypothetical protein
MTSTLKILLCTAAVCAILFCVTGVAFMFYHEQQSAQQAQAQRRAMESAADAQREQAEIERDRARDQGVMHFDPSTGTLRRW